MRFELSVALRYLLPRPKQLSVSIISLISILVISLVVWLVIVFLSVTEGIEKKWIDQLVSLNAPLRATPTEAYYRSYYHQIDNQCSASGYCTKTIGEKLNAPDSDPYDLSFDAELPPNFPIPDTHPDGSLRDLAKEAQDIISQFPSLRADEYEVSFGNLHLDLVRDDPTFLTQVSYISSYDPQNARMQNNILAPSTTDLNNFLHTLPDNRSLAAFLKNVQITQLRTKEEGYLLPSSLFPKEGSVKSHGLLSHGQINKVILGTLPSGQEGIEGVVEFHDGVALFRTADETIERPLLFLGGGLPLTVRSYLSSAEGPKWDVETTIDNVAFQGSVDINQLDIADATTTSEENSTFWVSARSAIPSDPLLGEGVLISKSFSANGVLLGDRGFLSYYSPTPTSVQEQKIPIYVAGFYDPGFMPVGNKVIYVSPKIIAMLRGNVTVADPMLGNGINIYLPEVEKTEATKAALIKAFQERGLDRYWSILAYSDYDFARPILQQLQSDKTLFMLIAIIILVVACSNIISMLILLVNDKKKEIGILQSMGASPRRIAAIFGICGAATGILSSVFGALAALYTLRHLQSLVNFLSFLQGHEAFQAAFYGDILPNTLSYNALVFVLFATLLISLLAGVVPAIKAARVHPSDILRAE